MWTANWVVLHFCRVVGWSLFSSNYTSNSHKMCVSYANKLHNFFKKFWFENETNFFSNAPVVCQFLKNISKPGKFRYKLNDFFKGNCVRWLLMFFVSCEVCIERHLTEFTMKYVFTCLSLAYALKLVLNWQVKERMTRLASFTRNYGLWLAHV